MNQGVMFALPLALTLKLCDSPRPPCPISLPRMIHSTGPDNLTQSFKKNNADITDLRWYIRYSQLENNIGIDGIFIRNSVINTDVHTSMETSEIII